MEKRVVDIPEEEETSSPVSSALVTRSSDEESRMQLCWGELKEDLRNVFTLVMNGDWLNNRSPHPSLPVMHEALLKLLLSNPHQLFEKLDIELRNVVIDIKSRLAALLSQQDNPKLPEMFLQNLLLGYERLCDSCKVLSPVIGSLEVNHLSNFSLTWELLSKHWYQLFVLEDTVIQDNIQDT